MNAQELMETNEKPDLTPMIDVVFLLLIFFMVTTVIIKEESDLGIQLPTDTPANPTDELPNRHIIDIYPDGSIDLNGGPMASGAEQGKLYGLVATLKRIKGTSDRSGIKTVVVIQADPVSPHYKSIQVLNACAAADINFVSFANF